MASPGSSTSTSALAPLSSPWPWVGLSLGILLTLSAWLLVLRGERTRLEGLRAVQASEMTTHLDKRMLALGQVLQGAAGYLGRGPLPSRSEWQEYVASLHLGDT